MKSRVEEAAAEGPGEAETAAGAPEEPGVAEGKQTTTMQVICLTRETSAGKRVLPFLTIPNSCLGSLAVS